MIRTFLDANILISAARGDKTDSERALALLASPRRRFLTSVFVRLEVYPKVVFHKLPEQRQLMNEFFMDPALEWASDLNAVVHRALSEAETHNVGPFDSLHAAAALLLDADEFVTAEKREKPLYRVRGLNAIHIDDVD